jgi:chromosome segregation ATPase
MTKKQRRLARQAAEAQAQAEAQQAQVQVEEKVEVEATPTPVVETTTPETPAVELDPEIAKLEAEFEALINPQPTSDEKSAFDKIIESTPEYKEEMLLEDNAAVPAEQIAETVKTVTPEQIQQMSDIYVDTSTEQIKTLQAKVKMLESRLNNADEAFRQLEDERNAAIDELAKVRSKNKELNAKAVELVAEKGKLKELCNAWATRAKAAEEKAVQASAQINAQNDAIEAAYNKGYEDSRAKAQFAYTELEKKLNEQVTANEQMKTYYSKRLEQYLKAMKASGILG